MDEQQKQQKGFYDFTNTYRGQALIIANEIFPVGFALRPGAVNDIKMMQILFKALDFNVHCFKDLTAQQMMEVIEFASKEKKNKESDCFALVISSHGSEEKYSKGNDLAGNETVMKHCIYGTDGGIVFADDILNLFNDENATGLAGKPKLFFFQACRSSSNSSPYDYGLMVQVLTLKPVAKPNDVGPSVPDNAPNLQEIPNFNSDEFEDIYKVWNKECTDNKTWKSYEWHESQSTTDTKQNQDFVANQDSQTAKQVDKTDAGGASDDGIVPRVPFELVPDLCHKDCLIMYPVVSGRYAFTNILHGSYLLRYMYETMVAIVKDGNLLKYLTSVCRKMSEYEYLPNPIPADMTEEEEKNLPFKMCACLVHRLTKDVQFEPKKQMSCMGKVRQLYETLYNKI